MFWFVCFSMQCFTTTYWMRLFPFQPSVFRYFNCFYCFHRSQVQLHHPVYIRSVFENNSMLLHLISLHHVWLSCDYRIRCICFYQSVLKLQSRPLKVARGYFNHCLMLFFVFQQLLLRPLATICCSFTYRLTIARLV